MKELADISILMISFDTGLLSPNSSGDAAARHRIYANGLKQLDIIVFGKAEATENKLTENCRVYGVGNSLWSVFKARQLAMKLQRKNNYDLVDTQDPHLTGLVGWCLKRKYKVKLEVHFHGDFWNNKFWLAESWKNKFYNLLQQKIVPKADAIRIVNKKIKTKLVDSGIKENIISVINTPVNEIEFVRPVNQSEVDKIKNNYNKKILLFVGRLVAAKNLFFLLNVINKLAESRDDFVLLMIGQGEQKNDLQAFVKENNLSEVVHILEPKTHSELVAYYRAAYLSVLMSTNESFGKVIIESGFAGTATLASEALGPSAIIEEGQNGWLVPINDAGQTLNKLNKLLDDKDLVERVATRAKNEFLKFYSQEESYHKVNDFWSKIVNSQL